MELKAVLEGIYSEKDKFDFITEQNRINGYEIREGSDNRIEAWGLTPEEEEEKRKEEIKKLKCTKRVFLLILENFGVTYSQIKELLADDEQAQMEWDLCVELERGNPLLNDFAERIGVSTEFLDWVFKKANGSTEPPPIEPTPVTE